MSVNQKLRSPSNLVAGALLLTFTLLIAALEVFDVAVLPVSAPALF